jgi:hypothetical protein
MQQQSSIERKGVLSFLIITFAITYAIEGILILSGFRFAAIPGPYGQLVVFAARYDISLNPICDDLFVLQWPLLDALENVIITPGSLPEHDTVRVRYPA